MEEKDDRSVEEKSTEADLIDRIDAHRNVLVNGPTGVGKSIIACALGNSTARAGYTVLYIRAPL